MSGKGNAAEKTTAETTTAASTQAATTENILDENLDKIVNDVEDDIKKAVTSTIYLFFYLI